MGILKVVSTKNREERRSAARAEREAAERAAARAAQRRTRLQQLGGALVAAAVVVVAVVLIAGSGGDDEAGSANTSAADGAVNAQAEIAEQLDGIAQDGIALGEPDAPITIVEFGDLQCPACAAFSNDEMPKLVEDYIRPGKARMEFRTLTFLGEDSQRLGLMAAAAADQDKLYNFAELVFANHGQENSGYATDDYLRRIGGAIEGFDVAAAMEARESADASQQLADADRLASINGVRGTPSFLVGRTGGEMQLVDSGRLGSELQRLAEDVPAER